MTLDNMKGVVRHDELTAKSLKVCYGFGWMICMLVFSNNSSHEQIVT